MVEVCSARILQLSCGSRESGQSAQFSEAGDPSLDACASATRSKTPAHLASPRRSCGPLAPPTCHPSSLSQPALRRQASEVRAACSNPARADPCGGRQATDVPTATVSCVTIRIEFVCGVFAAWDLNARGPQNEKT